MEKSPRTMMRQPYKVGVAASSSNRGTIERHRRFDTLPIRNMGVVG
jgi:hypothetical protein